MYRNWRGRSVALATALALLLFAPASGAALAEEVDISPSPEVAQSADKPTPTETKSESAPEPESVKETEAAKPAPESKSTSPEPSKAPAKESKTDAKAAPSSSVEEETAKPQVSAKAEKAEAKSSGSLPDNYPGDADRPFILTSEGVKLTSGTFKSGDHVNTQPGGSIHIEGNGQPGEPYIGKNLVPWSALGYKGGECVTWGQVAGFDYHFGENNQNRQGGVDERGWKYCIPGNTPQPKSQYITVLWQVDDWGEGDSMPPAKFPQSYVAKKVTDKPDLGALDDLLKGKCVGFQVDVYRYTKDADIKGVNKLIGSGELLGSYQDSKFLVDGGQGKAWKFYTDTNCSTPPPTLQQCEAVVAGPLATNLDHNGWDFSQTRTTGHFEFVSGGLRVWTEAATSTDKVAGYIPASFPLADLGLGFGVDVVNNGSGSVPPSLQIVLSTGQILVYEPGFYGTNNVWSNQAVPGLSAGMGYTSFGSVNQILAAASDAQVAAIGFSLGSGVHGDWTISAIQVGCVKYTFDKVVQPQIVVPTIPVLDECGPDNAVYGDVPDGEYAVERHDDGSVTLRAKGNSVFPGGVTSVTLPAPVDSGELCPEPPAPVEPVLPETTPQVCTPPSGELTSGTITLPETAGVEYSVWKDSVQVTNLDSVAPGGYMVKAAVTAEGTVFGPTDGWTLSEDRLVATTTVVVEAARDCTIVPPEPRTEEKSENFFSCEGEVTTTTWYEVPVVWDAELGEWVDGPEETWVAVETISSIRELTDQEKVEWGCVVPTPTPKPTPTPTTPPKGELPRTGGSDALAGLAVVGLVLTLVGGVAVAARRRG